MRKQDTNLNFNDGVGIFGSNLNYDWLSFIFADIAIDPGQNYYLDIKARSNYTIQKLCLQADIGTISLTVFINGVAITGLTDVEASYTITDYTATANNEVTSGDVVHIEIGTLTDSPLELRGNLLIKRT